MSSLHIEKRQLLTVSNIYILLDRYDKAVTLLPVVYREFHIRGPVCLMSKKFSSYTRLHYCNLSLPAGGLTLILYERVVFSICNISFE